MSTAAGRSAQGHRLRSAGLKSRPGREFVASGGWPEFPFWRLDPEGYLVRHLLQGQANEVAFPPSPALPMRVSGTAAEGEITICRRPAALLFETADQSSRRLRDVDGRCRAPFNLFRQTLVPVRVQSVPGHAGSVDSGDDSRATRSHEGVHKPAPTVKLEGKPRHPGAR